MTQTMLAGTTDDLDVAGVLEAQAEQRPDALLALFPREQRQASYGELDELANRFANGLAGLGVSAGTSVAQLLTNSLEYLVSSYAIKKLGCVEVAVNAEFRGPSLTRMLNLTQAEVLVTSIELIPALEIVFGDLTALRTVVLLGGDPDEVRPLLPGARVVAFAELLASAPSRPDRHVHPGDVQAIYFTSGTTGTSKGCMLSHRYAIRFCANHVDMLGLTEADRAYCPWPLHHVTAAYLAVLNVMLVGGSTVIVPRFSLSRFWSEVRETESTFVELVGTIPRLLLLGDPTPAERDHRLRIAPSSPLPPDPVAFEERFGVKLVQYYGSTDVGVISVRADGPSADPTNFGTLVRDIEVAILDEEDRALPPGEHGEIGVRANVPDILTSGYFGMPEQTMAARRNLWFHTGDVGYFDADGDLHFLGRKQERIRRGGENISVFEVQEVLESHPDVLHSAVVPVPSEFGEDEVHAFVQLNVEATFQHDELLDFCRLRMARFMVPSNIIAVDALPITPTGKLALKELIERATAARDGS